MITDATSFAQTYLDTYVSHYGHEPAAGDARTRYTVLAQVLADELRRRLAKSPTRDANVKQVYYFSMEFLIGNMLTNTLSNLQVEPIVREGLAKLKIDLDELLPMEDDAALGNGGLGRLAACFLDSMASLGIAGHGNGIYYRRGLFKQGIENCQQAEIPETWQEEPYPWAVRRSDQAVDVKFGGDIHMDYINGRMYFKQIKWQAVRAVPYEIPVIAWNDPDTVNILRLWKAESIEGFDLPAFNRGDFLGALSHESWAESISAVLYPNDNNFEGRRLRLMQEYFFVAAGLAAILRDYRAAHNGSLSGIEDKICIHINDTHPTLCIPELMRILVDEEGMEWDDAWKIMHSMISYTNHTVLPEALECWPTDLMRSILPRIHMIIEEINRRWMDTLYRKGDLPVDQIAQMAILRDGQVHMATLSVVGSYSVNGVASLHTEILKRDVLHPYYQMFPERFNNKTNGISHRSFLIKANPLLTELLCDVIGPSWMTHPQDLEKLLPYVDDKSVQHEFAKVKHKNKMRLAEYVRKTQGLVINHDAIFDVQVKRIHAYKRQLLNLMHIMHLYNRVLAGDDVQPRVFFLAGKSAPGYAFAKSIIRLTNTLAQFIDNDPVARKVIQVVFLPNLNVSLGEMIYPAADISQQISTAGKEASGTGNMKFMMNGAITLCTLDGANVEILDLVGEENAIRFGLTVEQIQEMRQKGSYHPSDYYRDDANIRQVINQLSGALLPGDTNQFQDIVSSLLQWGDEFFVLGDFDMYRQAQERVQAIYREKPAFRRMQLTNIAKSGYFSSDRAITEYARDIWKLPGF